MFDADIEFYTAARSLILLVCELATLLSQPIARVKDPDLLVIHRNLVDNVVRVAQG